MRDFAIVLIVLGSVPLTLIRPQVGILMWFWLGMMNPHRYAWGYAQEFRVALVVAAATILGWLVSNEAKRPPNAPIIYALAAFTFWITLAAVLAIHPDIAIPQCEEYLKILLMTFVTTCIVRTRQRIDQLVWVIVLSLGFYGVKGGIFGILTGGSYRIWGPPGTFIADNNSLALALIMMLPFMHYLRTVTESRWVKLGILGMMGLTLISILCSYSRGALLGVGMMLFALLLKTRHRLVVGVLILGVAGGAMMLMPHQWYARMQSIDNYQHDESAQGRFQAWTFAFRLALDHPFVGGGQLIGRDDALFKHYVPDAPTSRAAHSIYFQVLGETGFVGLGLYLLLLLLSFRVASNIIRLTRNRPELAWARTLAGMTQVSLVGYCVSGSFLSLGFFDLYYAVVAIIAVTHFVVQREIAASQPAVEPGAVPARGRSLVPGAAFASGAPGDGLRGGSPAFAPHAFGTGGSQGKG